MKIKYLQIINYQSVTIKGKNMLDRIFVYMSSAFILMALMLISCALTCSYYRLQINEISISYEMEEAKQHAKDIRCYEQMYNVAHRYLDVYQIGNSRVAVNGDDKGACKSLERKRGK